MSETNEKIIKIVGSACIPDLLEHGHDYQVIVDTQCNEVTERDNQNGTHDKIFKLRMFGAVKIISQGKTVIQGSSVKERTPSQRLRAAFFRVWEQTQSGTKEDWEAWYKEEMGKIIEGVQKKINEV